MKFLIFLAITIDLMAASMSNQCGYFPGNSFTQYQCPEKAGMESTLTSINSQNGNAVCTYRGPNGERTSITLRTECKVPLNVKLTDGTVHASAVMMGRGMTEKIGYKVDSEIFDTQGLREKMKSVKDDLSGRNSFDAIASQLPPLNSHTNYSSTVPSIITGVLTLDGDYFEHVGGKVQYINEVGEVSINPELLQITRDSSWSGRVWDNVKSFFMGDGEATTTDTASYKSFNPMNFMDQQILGFYVYLSENIMAAYMTIVWYIFLGGAMWGGGYYGYKRFFSKTMKNDDFKGNFKTYSITAIFGLIFFTAPIIVSDVDKTGAIQKAIYKDDNKDSSSMYGYSTLAQQSVRYAGQLGTYFGNVESDYAMKAYLALLRFKQGMLEDPSKVTNTINTRLTVIENKMLEAAFAANYLQTICKPYFSGVDVYKLTPGQVQQLSLTSKTPEGDQILSKNGITADRLNIATCLEANQQLADIASSVINTKKSINNELNTYSDMYDKTSTSFGGSSSEQNMFFNFMQLMVWTQNNFGWIASITPHSSYLFFKNIDVFEYRSGMTDRSEKDDANNYSQGADDKVAQEGEKSEKITSIPFDMIENVSSVIIGTVVNNSTWFIVPGFTGVYDFFKAHLQELTFKGSTGEFTSMASRLNNMKDALIGVVGKIPFIGALFEKVGGFITAILGIDDYMQFQILITFLSFFLAMWVVTTMISTVTVLSVTVFLTFKIVMYYVELIIFFMAAPVVGIYTTIISAEPQQYMKNFATNLGMLIITPMLIVSASYMVLPISEFFKGLFSALVTLIFKVFEKGADEMNYDVVGTNVLDSLTKQTALASMQGVAEIFAMVSTIIISYIVIFNYKEWFTKLIGLQGVVDHTKSAYSEMREKSDKYIAPM